MPRRVVASLTVDIAGVPEAIWAMRHEMAQMLREVADAEASAYVAQRLREVACGFEAGQAEDDA